MDEAVRELLYLGFGQYEAEVVLAVTAERERAVVLAEEFLVLLVFVLLLDDMHRAVAHDLHLAVAREGGHHHAVLVGLEVEEIQVVVVLAEGHLTGNRHDAIERIVELALLSPVVIFIVLHF